MCPKAQANILFQANTLKTLLPQPYTSNILKIPCSCYNSQLVGYSGGN